MIKLYVSSVPVDDQEKALDFYTRERISKPSKTQVFRGPLLPLMTSKRNMKGSRVLAWSFQWRLPKRALL